MGWFILKHIFSTILSIINITRLSNQGKDLEILILRQQLSILQRKHNSPIKPNRVEKITLAVLTARLKSITHRSANQLRDIIRIFQPGSELPVKPTKERLPISGKSSWRHKCQLLRFSLSSGCRKNRYRLWLFWHYKVALRSRHLPLYSCLSFRHKPSVMHGKD